MVGLHPQHGWVENPLMAGPRIPSWLGRESFLGPLVRECGKGFSHERSSGLQPDLLTYRAAGSALHFAVCSEGGPQARQPQAPSEKIHRFDYRPSRRDRDQRKRVPGRLYPCESE